MSFLRTYDGLLAVDQITLIEPRTWTSHGTPYQLVHYRHGSEIRVTRVHPDYVQRIFQEVEEQS